MTTLAVELSAFRLFAPVFGASNLISAVVIGLILLYLSAGYLIGGRLADRSPNPITFYRLIAWGAFLVGLIPFVAMPLLRLARDNLQNLGNLNVALIILAFGVTLIVFAVPVTLLGCVSPFAVRLVDAQRRTGGARVRPAVCRLDVGQFHRIVSARVVSARSLRHARHVRRDGAGVVGHGPALFGQARADAVVDAAGADRTATALPHLLQRTQRHDLSGRIRLQLHSGGGTQRHALFAAQRRARHPLDLQSAAS